jgi:Putative motility protein
MTAITASTAIQPVVQQASNSDPGTVAGAASLMVLKKALDQQAGSAVALTESLPQPTLANMGALGTQVNTYV